jgi:predicted  nucleic acid-binding Zn-ribbon protein
MTTEELQRELSGADQVIAALMARLDRANARIARLEEAGDSLKEEARPTMFDTDETRKRCMNAIDAWDAAREAKP